MAQSSLGFTTDGTGDGTATGYTSAQFQAYMRSLWIDDGDLDEQGVIYGQGNGLEVTVTGAGASQVDTGSALVYGIWYENTAAVAVAHTTPLIDTTGWRIVLRASWAAGTVRVTLVESADGVAAIPALTQVAGTTWDIPLAQGTITVGGVVTIASDDRKYVGQRTRTLWVPCWAYYDTTNLVGSDGSLFTWPANARGWVWSDNAFTQGYGTFIIPDDYVASLTVTPYIVPLAAAGNCYGYQQADYGANDELVAAHSNNSGWVAQAVAGALTTNDALPALTLASAAVGDIVRLIYARDATNVLDTVNSITYFLGWKASYQSVPTRP